MTQMVVKNEGGPGRFCIILSSVRLSCDTAGSKE